MTFHQVTFSASLMNMWIRKVVILALFCSVCLATTSERVYFTSKNFQNILHWIPAEPSVPGENITYKYSVEYKIHGDEYQRKAGCQNITALFCDLTEETSPTPNEHYLGQVFVNGKFHGSTKTRFTPLTHTTLGPPILSTNATTSALHVHAILPLGPNGKSIGDIMALCNNGSSEMQVSYTLTITSPEWAAREYLQENKPGGQFICKLKSNTTYCGHVFYKPIKRPGRPKSEKAYFCEKLKVDEPSPLNPLNYLPWLLLAAVCLLAVIILSIVCMWKYVNVDKKVSLPSNLIISKTPTKVLRSQNETISKLSAYPRNVTRDASTIQMKLRMPSASLGGYSPQDLPWQIWQDSSVETGVPSPTSDSEDTSAQSSVSYGAVVHHEPTENQGAFNDPEISNELRFPDAECGMTSVMDLHTGPPLSVQDCLDSDPSRPLLLHLVRDSEGKLVLPFWSSQFQSSTANLQRRLLLSELINSTTEQPSLLNLDDTELSECGEGMITAPTQMYDSHYINSHAVIPNLHQGSLNSSSTDGRSESCYRQNWIPKANIETVSMHSDSDRRTNYKRSWNGLKNEDGEAKEDREELERFQLSEHFLGNWQLQIQD